MPAMSGRRHAVKMGGTAEKRFFRPVARGGFFMPRMFPPHIPKEATDPMYRKVSTDMNFVEREKEVLDFWKREGIMEKKLPSPRRRGAFHLLRRGPPTANGRPHIGHIETRAIKDLIPRFQSMKGKDVLRKAGWDTHGLPVELEVEKLLGLGRQAADRGLRHRALHRRVQKERVEVPA